MDWWWGLEEDKSPQGLSAFVKQIIFLCLINKQTKRNNRAHGNQLKKASQTSQTLETYFYLFVSLPLFFHSILKWKSELQKGAITYLQLQIPVISIEWDAGRQPPFVMILSPLLQINKSLQSCDNPLRHILSAWYYAVLYLYVKLLVIKLIPKFCCWQKRNIWMAWNSCRVSCIWAGFSNGCSTPLPLA